MALRYTCLTIEASDLVLVEERDIYRRGRTAMKRRRRALGEVGEVSAVVVRRSNFGVI